MKESCTGRREARTCPGWLRAGISQVPPASGPQAKRVLQPQLGHHVPPRPRPALAWAPHPKDAKLISPLLALPQLPRDPSQAGALPLSASSSRHPAPALSCCTSLAKTPAYRDSIVPSLRAQHRLFLHIASWPAGPQSVIPQKG